MDKPSILDLVRFQETDYVVASIPGNGKIQITPLDWPVEFSEIDFFVIPDLIEVDEHDIKVIETAENRFTSFNNKLITAGSRAESDQAWDWNDVDALLLEAAGILPQHLLSIDLDNDSWFIDINIPDDILGLVRPAARILGTHAIGRGEADIADLSDAYAQAIEVHTSNPVP